jgi:hypothetical protein
MSSLVDDTNCVIEERESGRRLGIGVRHKGLWYLDIQQTDDALCTALTVFASDNEAKMLQHYWLGHMSFDTMSKIFPEELKNMDKEKTCV